MSKTIEISRESAIQRLTEIANRDSAVAVTVRAEDLRALLAAPAVERQSCGACNGCNNGCRLDQESPAFYIGEPLRNSSMPHAQYASPPEPASVVLPERAQPKSWNKADIANCDMSYIDGWNDCLDKVKELNQ